jgi:hypothetical protein
MRPALALCLSLLAAPAARADDYPHVYLKNEKLRVKVYLPDAQKGFYRGTRFDWAGVLGEVEFAGHKVFCPWKDTHDPTNHDDIVGPCEEFGMERPLGYDEAKPGETFLKIGVGELEKPKEEKYSFARKYRIVKPAEWRVTPPNPWVGRRATAIRFETRGALASGHGYEYSKSVVLTQSGSLLAIGHKLMNTGTKPITTDFYNHNFFNVDSDPVGPHYRFVFPFDLRANDLRGRFGELIAVEGKELRFKDDLTDGFVMAELTGFEPPNENDLAFEMRHSPSRLRVTVTHNYRYAKFNVWGVRTTICPEPFMRIENLQPGKSRAWLAFYLFEQDPPKK